MKASTRVIVVEDIPSDAELAERELNKTLGSCEFLRVETRDAFVQSLKTFRPDIIISDYRLPTFDGLTALRLAQQVNADLPFIILTGSINEETAVECMKAGAWDYVIKEHIKRLGSAARAALDLQQARRARQVAEASLRQSEQRLRVAEKVGRIGHWEYDLASGKTQWSDALYAIHGRDQLLGPPQADEEPTYYDAEVARQFHRCAERTIQTGESFEYSTTLNLPDGRKVDINTIGSALADEQGQVVRLVGTVQDVTERNKAESKIRHLNSVLLAIRDINKLIVRERDPNALAWNACQMLVEHRGFRGAWIGLLEDGAGFSAWAEAGFGLGFGPLAEELMHGQAPACVQEMVRRDSRLLQIDRRVHCAKCPIREQYPSDEVTLAHLSHEGRDYGVLAVSFPQELVLDEEEETLLVEVAADLGFALHEIELKGQRDRYAQIVASSQEAMALISPRLVVLEANAAFGRMVEAPPAVLTGRAVASVIGSESFLEFVQPSLEQCLAGQVVQVRSSYSAKDAPSRYWDMIFSPCLSADSSVFAAALCIRDITEQRQAELTLEVERDNLNALLATLPIAILVLDQKHRVVHANSAALLLGSSQRNDQLGERYCDVLGCANLSDRQVGSEDADCEDCQLHSCVRLVLEERKTLLNQDVALQIVKDQGAELRWFVANLAPLTVQGGPGAVLALHEVTERRKAEDTLRFQAMLLESQNEASIDGIAIEDEHCKPIWHNRRFAELWSLTSEDEVIGDVGVDALPIVAGLENASVYLERVQRIRGDSTAKSRDEIRLRDGRVFDCYSAPVMHPSARRLGRVWLFRDVSAEKRLQASAIQADRLASMGLLAAGVAHEINNPLSYVLYNLESLTDDLQSLGTQSSSLQQLLVGELGLEKLHQQAPEWASLLDANALGDMTQRLDEALAGTRRIKDIAKGLGSFSRVEKEQFVPVELRGPIESAISIVFNEIKYRAHLVKDLRATHRVLASEGRLSQVFLNLLVNAAHAIVEGDVDGNRIVIKTWDDENGVIAAVEDTGCGIPQEHIEKIFEPFFTTKPIGIGSGLGLNIVRSIITGYGGTIAVSSVVGKGTAFTIRLPSAMASTPTAASRSSRTDRPKPENCGRILVVDDESAVRAVISRILHGHDVVQAESGKRACDLLAVDQDFDLILCDMMMPQVSGIDVHRWLVEHHPRLAQNFVFLTGGAFTPNVRTYLEQVENVAIEKPFDARNLAKLVVDWVRSGKASRGLGSG